MNHSKFLSALNLGTIKLQTSNSANAAQFRLQNNLKVRTTYIYPQTHSRNNGQVMFQSNPNSEVNRSRSSNDLHALKLAGPPCQAWMRVY